VSNKKTQPNKVNKVIKKSKIREYAEALITALILALIIRAYVIQAYKIPSGSMIPTLLIGDHILVNKFIYGTKIPFSNKRVLNFNEPQRGDIVVFQYPKDPSRDFIKRVIAVGEEKIEIRGENIYINNKLIDDPWGYYEGQQSAYSDPITLTVPKDKYFVMGDNRNNSHDSRFWGFVSRNEIVGRAVVIYFSLDKDADILHMSRWSRIGKHIR
jgi:signal peptidase I